MNPRNFLIAIVLFLVLIVGFAVVGNLLSALLPLLIVAVIAFILGRLSVHFNLIEYIRSARAGQPSVAEQGASVLKNAASFLQKPAPTATNPAETKAAAAPAKTAPASKTEEAIPQRPVNPDLLLDPNFEIKTPEQVEAEARLAEQEAKKQAASADVNAALEARRKRLLGDKGQGG